MTREEIERASQSGPHCFLYREALQNGWIDHSMHVRNSGMWYVPFLAEHTPDYGKKEHETQIRAYLCESLATALDHSEPVIRVRAAYQAFCYAGRLEGMGTTPGSRHCDALLEVRNWLESCISACGFLPQLVVWEAASHE